MGHTISEPECIQQIAEMALHMREALVAEEVLNVALVAMAQGLRRIQQQMCIGVGAGRAFRGVGVGHFGRWPFFSSVGPCSDLAAVSA